MKQLGLPWNQQVETAGERLILVRAEHPWKAERPIIVTESGMVMAVREEHP